jgi:hypothetical protein
LRLRNILILLVILLGLGGAYYFINSPEPPESKEPRYYAWLIEMDDILHIEISLPREGKSQSFIKIPKEDTFPWYFDDPQRSNVDTQRWGGGIPLLLSGPGVERVISKNTTPEKLAEFGLAQPQMVINLLLTDNKTMTIPVGNKTPDGASYYVLAPDTSNDVALVDRSWYEVLARIVTEPPYAPPPKEEE